MKTQEKGVEWNKIGKIAPVIDAIMGIIGCLYNNAILCVLALLIVVILVIICCFKTSSEIKRAKRWFKHTQNRIEKDLIYIEKELALEQNITPEQNILYNQKQAGCHRSMYNAFKRYEEKKKDLRNNRESMMRLCLFAGIIIIGAGIKPISSWALEIMNQNNEVTEDDIPFEGNNTDPLIDGGIKSDGEENNIIIPGMSFYLDETACEKFITLEQKNAVFYVNVEDSNSDQVVQEHIRAIINQNFEDSFTYMASISERNSAAAASEKEAIFYNSITNVKRYAAENNYIRWKEELRHSSELDEIIAIRLALWDSDRRNSYIAFMLANNYQAYALEYRSQRESSNTTLYYYVESILWSEKALAFEWADKEKIFTYIKGRYKDIADFQDVPDSIRLVAQAIYDGMVEYSDYID